MKDLSKKYNKEIEDLIVKFDKLQEERAKTYTIFEEGNKAYLNSGPDYDFVTYREVVNEVTNKFKGISEEIIDIENSLREKGVTDISNIISSVQDYEKQKLQLTVEHQLARQMVADSANNELEKSTEREIRLKLSEVVEKINDDLTELRYILCDE